jgi:hypothetical protein
MTASISKSARTLQSKQSSRLQKASWETKFWLYKTHRKPSRYTGAFGTPHIVQDMSILRTEKKRKKYPKKQSKQGKEQE